jgi:hypothetical protein
VPPETRRATIAAFGSALRATIADLPEIELLPPPARERRPGAGWDSLPGIFTFVLRRTGRRMPGDPLEYEDGRRVYQWLNGDVSGRLPDADAADRALAARCCHTPQPVKLGRTDGDWIAGMRIAAGARLVSGVAMDPMLGADPDKRLQSELRDMATVLRKAALIARRWDAFDAPAAAPEPDSRGRH